MTVEQVAELFDVLPGTVRQWRTRKILKAKKSKAGVLWFDPWEVAHAYHSARRTPRRDPNEPSTTPDAKLTNAYAGLPPLDPKKKGLPDGYDFVYQDVKS